MLGRVSYFQTHRNIRSGVQEQKKSASKLSEQLSSQNRIQQLREDPISAAHGAKYMSQLSRKETFSKQNRRAYDSLQLSEGYMREMTEILHKVRDLAVESANGTYEAKDRKNMAIVLDEYIDEMYQVVNARDSDGRYLFAGADTTSPPFYALRSSAISGLQDSITSVEYLGSDLAVETRISEQESVTASIPGSKLIWTGSPRIYGTSDQSGFVLQADSSIYANGKEISFTQGDTLPEVIQKINTSETSIRAFQAPITGEIVLEGSNSEQLWLKDVTGTVLQDFGIINDNDAPYNVAGDASKFDETLFTALIDFRNSLDQNDNEAIGGKVLGAIDRSMDSTLESLAKVGAVSERLDIVYERIESKDILNITAQINDELAIDFADLIVKWRSLEQVQQATFAISSQIMSTSLLNYLI